jgi:hypothetical protein
MSNLNLFLGKDWAPLMERLLERLIIFRRKKKRKSHTKAKSLMLKPTRLKKEQDMGIFNCFKL